MDIANFLWDMIAAVPCTIHIVLTHNGTHFFGNNPESDLVQEEIKSEQPVRFRVHAFAYGCEQNAIEHRRTQAKHPWTNGQGDRKNRTLKDATVNRLTILRGLTPYRLICQSWHMTPLQFNINPFHHTVTLKIQRLRSGSIRGQQCGAEGTLAFRVAIL